MKKWLIGLVACTLLIFSGLQVAKHMYLGGTAYYVQITNDGTKKVETADNGETFVNYEYELTGFDDEGEKKTLNFASFRERPLKREAYLKLTWNKNKGVTSFEEVSEKELPDTVAQKLEDEK